MSQIKQEYWLFYCPCVVDKIGPAVMRSMPMPSDDEKAREWLKCRHCDEMCLIGGENPDEDEKHDTVMVMMADIKRRNQDFKKALEEEKKELVKRMEAIASDRNGAIAHE